MNHADSYHPAEFMAGDAVLAIGNRPECGHPFIKGDRGIFHHRANLDGELLVAGIAVPDTARLDERVLGLIAPISDNVAAKPAQLNRIIKAALRIGEINYGLLRVLGGILSSLKSTPKCLCAKPFIAGQTC